MSAIVPAWQPQWVGAFGAVLPASLEYLEQWTGGSRGDIVVRATGLETTSWAPTIVTVGWVTGSAVALLYLLVQLIRLFRISWTAQAVSDPRLLRLASEAAQAVGVGQRIVLLHSGPLAVPVTWGTRAPRVLLPVRAAEWSDTRLKAVLAHELAHIRRGDWRWHMLAEVCCAAYWFNPLFWLARTELRREGERAADDAVLALGMDGRDYAAHLVEIVRGSRTPAPAPTAAMARASDLAGRVAALMDVRANRRSVSPPRRGGVIAAAAVAALPLAALAAPEVLAYVQVRTATLPTALAVAVSQATDTPANPVRTVRVSAAAAAPSLTPPEVVEYTTPPLYSDDARRLRIEGVVVAQAHVGTDGRAQRASILKGLGHGLDQNALVALRQWRFLPAIRNGVPVATDVEVEIEFTLQQESLNELIANDMATQVGPGVTPPRAVVAVQPPPIPRARGTVVLDVVLLETGRPKIVRILKAVSPELDESAVRTFEAWRFSPATRDGIPVKVRMTAEVNFHG
jgi:TonB family protein